MKLKAFKYRLDPNQQQQTMLNKTLGCTRLIYNQMLNERQTKYTNQDKTPNKTEKEYKEVYPFMKEIDSISLQQARIDLQFAYKNHFRKIKKKEKTSLKFKSRKNPKNTYRTLNINNSIRIENNTIKIPKIGYVKFKKSREVQGKINSITISKTLTNKYYIAILCETEIETLIEKDNIIGIDLGVSSYLTDQDGNKQPNHKYFKKYQKKLARQQCILSKRQKGSKRRQNQRIKVFRIHEKIRNSRNDTLHKISTKLINENQVICLEDLSVKKLIEDKEISKEISDCAWSTFVNMLKYKANWYGREIIQVDRYFPSSQLCSSCGYRNVDLKLKDRIWICPICGIEHDRDINSAKNILAEGIRIINRRAGGVSSLNNKTLVLSS